MILTAKVQYCHRLGIEFISFTIFEVSVYHHSTHPKNPPFPHANTKATPNFDTQLKEGLSKQICNLLPHEWFLGQRDLFCKMPMIFFLPIGSMYGIFANIYHKNHPNVGKYTSPMDPMGGKGTFFAKCPFFKLQTSPTKILVSRCHIGNYTTPFIFNGCFWFPLWVGSVAYNHPIGKCYKWYISGIYCQLGDYMVPTTY